MLQRFTGMARVYVLRIDDRLKLILLEFDSKVLS